MRCRLRRLLAALPLAAAVVLAAAPAARADVEVPFLTGRVNDYADMIPADVEGRIASRLEAFEQQTGAQVAVLTVESLEGEPVEDYALRVAETWGLGQAERDNGVLLLVAKADRKMRIEVGYGLEGELTDLQAGRILSDVIRPRFRAGDFGGGIEAGVDAILGTLEGKDVLPPPASLNEMPLPMRLFGLGMFLLVVGTFSMLALFSKGCQSWFLYLFLVPFHLMFPMALLTPVAGMIWGGAWLLGFPILKLVLRGTGLEKRWGKAFPAFRGGWTGGGFGGGGFSGGGFSGGGGSFGGGGASGGW